MARFVVTGTRLACAVVASGKFKSAFPDGLPGGADSGAEAAKEGEEPEKPPAHIQEAAEANSVVVIADVDFIGNNFIIVFLQSCLEAKRRSLPSSPTI